MLSEKKSMLSVSISTLVMALPSKVSRQSSFPVLDHMRGRYMPLEFQPSTPKYAFEGSAKELKLL
jgi:hypothetical protein